jgi:hypothetical protein
MAAGAEAGPPTPAIPPQGIKMSFMELAQAASKQGQKAGIETAASEGNQSNQSGKAMTLHDLEAQLTGATSIPEHAAGEGAGAGRPPRGPPPGIPVPVPVVNTAQQPQQQPGQQQAPQPSGSPLTMQANAQASQALMGLLKKGSAPSATAVPIAAPTPAESSATTPPPPAPSALAPAPSAPPVPAAPPATTGLGGLPFGGLGSILSSNQVWALGGCRCVPWLAMPMLVCPADPKKLLTTAPHVLLQPTGAFRCSERLWSGTHLYRS